MLQGKINRKKGSQCIYISVVLIDLVYRKDKNYYPQVFLDFSKNIDMLLKKFLLMKKL